MSILCLLGRHNFQTAHNHPDGQMGYCIYECTRCPKAIVSDPALGGTFPILNTQAAIARNTGNAPSADKN